MALHQNFTRVVLFAGVADGRATEASDVDIAALYELEPYNYSTHQEILGEFRTFKATVGQAPFPVHLVILDENDVQAGEFPTSKNIRDQGIILCMR